RGPRSASGGADRPDPSGPGGRARDGERPLGNILSGVAGGHLRARGAGRGGACHPGRGTGGRAGQGTTHGRGGAVSSTGELALAEGDSGGGRGDLGAGGVGRRPPPGSKIAGVAGRYESGSPLAPAGEAAEGARPAR